MYDSIVIYTNMSQRPVPFINAFVWLCLMAATQVAVYAMQANPAPFDAVQPDGSVHTLFLRGNEMFNFVETPEGFQVVEMSSTTTPDMTGKTGDSDKPLWVYAQQDQATGAVVPSPYALGSVNPAAVGIAPVQLRPGMDSPFAFNTASVLAASASASAPEAGLLPSLIDQPANTALPIIAPADVPEAGLQLPQGLQAPNINTAFAMDSVPTPDPEGAGLLSPFAPDVDNTASPIDIMAAQTAGTDASLLLAPNTASPDAAPAPEAIPSLGVARRAFSDSHHHHDEEDL